jgi:hypothetical protein
MALLAVIRNLDLDPDTSVAVSSLGREPECLWCTSSVQIVGPRSASSDRKACTCPVGAAMSARVAA